VAALRQIYLFDYSDNCWGLKTLQASQLKNKILFGDRMQTENNVPESVPEGDGKETMPSLEDMLRKAELEAQEHHDAWLRAKAETENIRRRAQEDVAKAHKFAVESFASELLPVKDSLEAALSADPSNPENLKNGVDLTLKQLSGVFSKFSLTALDPAGEDFDPHRHQAISMVESDQPANTVVMVLQKGYLLHDRVIRPALVMVAKQKE
jgi:molecular chaperone GrpE